MKIACLGGGPAGLYFAISMKLRDPGHDVTVYERNRRGDTFGWGVVFSDQTMENLRQNDPESAKLIGDNFAHWDDIDVFYRGARITSSGHGFVGIGRKRLLNLLQDRARELDVKLEFEVEMETDLSPFADCDLIVASDGLNSKIRNAKPDVFKVDIQTRANKFVWLGTHQVFDAFTFAFEETEHGWIWAHAYRFDNETSTFIIECSEETYLALGFDKMSQDETCRAGERIFAKYLGGHELMTNARHLRGSAWLNFPRVVCHNWHDGNVVLLGDAAHTAHFSIGSGTKLAFEDAIKLASVLHSGKPLETALVDYQEERQVEVLKIQNSARNSTEWFEHMDRQLHLEPQQFAYSLLTRSQRVSHENLRLRDREFLEGVERWFSEHATGTPANTPVPPMFTPLELGGMTLSNRVVVSPMCMYSAVDGTPDDFHLVHYGARGMGRAGLIFTEMTNVSPDARITHGCTGMYKPEHVAAWKRIVDFVHSQGDTKFALQLGHAGRKGSTRIPWEEDFQDQPLAEGGWEVIAPSPLPWSPRNPAPRQMTRDDMDQVLADFVRATRMGQEAGFDMVELHCGHGYLLSSFLTPLSNTRTDEYGGSIENRMRYPLEVFTAMRAAWKGPMSVRISATDWVDEGLTEEDTIAMAKAFAQAGADLIDVSAGQTSPNARPVYGRMFQTPFSDLIRNEARVRTMAVGNIFEPDHLNSILAAGRADLCALARPHLMDPSWSLRAAAELNYDGVKAPSPYQSGQSQLQRNITRQQQMIAV